MSSGEDDPFTFAISSNKSYNVDKLSAFSSFFPVSFDENEQIGIVKIVAVYISKLSHQHKGLVFDISRSVEGVMKSIRDSMENHASTRKNEIGYSLGDLVILGKELKIFFEVPNRQILSSINLTLSPNEAVAFVINFFLLMIEAILRFKEGVINCKKGSIEILQTELGFLINFLGDKAMHLQPTRSFFYSLFVTIVVYNVMSTLELIFNPMIDFEAVVNVVKGYLHFDLSRFVNYRRLRIAKRHEYRSRRFSDFLTLSALSELIIKFDLLKTKIKNHCITASKMPMDMAPKTAMVSLFIVDSVLDDLMDLIDNKSHRIFGVKIQIVMLHKELMLLRSSIKDIAEQREAEYEELVTRAGDIAYEIEYVINSFPHVWYLTLRLPQLIEKIQLFTMAVKIKKIKNNVGAAGPGMPEVGKYQDEKSPVFEDTIVGFKKVATEISEQLVRGTGHLQIISIFGMSGVGKTTLANKLYNDPSVVYHFDKRSWCVVSQRFNKENVLIEILSSMSLTKRETFINMEEESLAENVYKNLKGRRYLIVISMCGMI